MVAATRIFPKAVEAFRSGEGIGWHEHDPELFQGTERFFRPGYMANLVQSWIPALDGVEAKLASGARVADIGCGYGASTIIMAKAYPSSTFWGFDYHEGSIEAARKAAERGEQQYLLLRFPNGLCTDDARAINEPPNPHGPRPFRGEAADIRERWHAVLRPLGSDLY